MTTIEKTTVRLMAEDIIKALDVAGEALLEAGKALAVFIDASPNGIAELMKAEPRLSEKFLYNLERVGRGQLDYRLMIDLSPGACAVRRLPSQHQKRALDTPVKLARLERGRVVTYEKPVSALSVPEADLAFSKIGVRKPEEQAEILRRVNQPSDSRKHACVAQRYQIDQVDGWVTFLAQTRVSPAQLQEIADTARVAALKTLKAKK